MQLTQLPNNEAAILTRLVGLDSLTLSPEVAQAILTIGFGQADKDRICRQNAGRPGHRRRTAHQPGPSHCPKPGADRRRGFPSLSLTSTPSLWAAHTIDAGSSPRSVQTN